MKKTGQLAKRNLIGERIRKARLACKPPLLLVGEVGAGKTALAKSISQFYGIAPAISKVEEMTESNFWPCVNDGGIYCLDNADTRTTWLTEHIQFQVTLTLLHAFQGLDRRKNKFPFGGELVALLLTTGPR